MDANELSAIDRQLLWHPFTQSATAEPNIPIGAAKGAYLYKEDGCALLDAISSWWVNLHGHSHPHIAEAVYRQALELEHVIFAGFTHRPAAELASRLSRVVPGALQRFFFSDNGSTAVEVGLKMALQYWHNLGIPRTRILALEGSYHGDTFGAMSLSERSAFNAPFSPYLFDVEYLPAPLPGFEEASMAAIDRSISDEKVAVFVYEPLVQGAGGMRMYTPEVLDKMLARVRSSGALLLADEVMTGFYRTGRLFASDHAPANAPDIMALSKGLTGGAMALGLTLCRESIYEAFCSTRMEHTFFHGHSYTANPLACAAALASLDLTLSEQCASAVARIERNHRAFSDSLPSSAQVLNMRVQGSILALDLNLPGQGGYFHPVRKRLYPYFIERGVLLRPLGNTLYVMPPYCFSDDNLNMVYDVIHSMLEELPSWTEYGER